MTHGPWRLPPAAIYELSADRNLIHIVLDIFPSHIFAEIRDGDRPAVDRGWSGFTFFREHLGAFRTTLGSMPAMLTGVPWRNEMRFDRYARRHPSVFHALGQHGYRLRSLTAHSPDHPSDRFPGAEGAVRYTIPSPYGSRSSVHLAWVPNLHDERRRARPPPKISNSTSITCMSISTNE